MITIFSELGHDPIKSGFLGDYQSHSGVLLIYASGEVEFSGPKRYIQSMGELPEMGLEFEWDEVKDKANFKKHQVHFAEGKSIFNDPYLVSFPDTSHSEDEERLINIGLSAKTRILVLIHTERQGRIRIISCRKATAKERKFYEEARS